MSSTTNSSSSKPAPWRSAFLDSMSKLDTPEFVLATVERAQSNSKAPTPYLPRARFCIYRGLWAELPENSHNPAEKNPRIYESDLPAFTTDVRMEKVGQLFRSSAGKADSDEKFQGSGGGGPVEAVWWLKDEGVQWRITGTSFILSTDIDEESDSQGTSEVRTVKSEIGERMRLVKGMEGKQGDWSWSKEITGHFGNMSPGLRGTFKAPPPGQRLDRPYDDKNLHLGGTVEDLHDEIARRNFRVCVIKPDRVEKLFLKDPTKAQRWRWTVQASGEWEEEETWP